MTGFESFVGVNPWTALFTFCNEFVLGDSCKCFYEAIIMKHDVLA